MRTEEVVVRGVLLWILVLLNWAICSKFASSGVPAVEIILLCIAIFLLGIAFSRILHIITSKTAIYCIGGAAIAAIILITIHFHLISYCGDNICGAGECGACGDCKPEQCADGKCQPPLESCTNSQDCACTTGYVCAKGRATSDRVGCYERKCGDGYCDRGESSENCCLDCGCAVDFSCLNNACYFKPPAPKVEILMLNDTISALSLYGNPTLTDDNGKPRPYAAVTIQTSGYMKDTKVTFAVPGLLENTVDGGFIKPGDTVPVPWYITPDKRLLSIQQDLKTQLIVNISYSDAQKISHSRAWVVPITIENVHTIDNYGHVVLYVTNDIRPEGNSPDSIWDSLRKQVTIVEGPDQFPHETLAKGTGSSRSMAFLLASAYDVAGLYPSIVVGPKKLIGKPNELFVRVRSRDGYVIIDPARVNSTFEQASISVPGGIYEVKQVRGARNFTTISFTH